MPGLKPSNVLRLVPLACLLFSVRAFAQFEIAPDHFDGDESQTVRSTRGNDKASAAKSATRVHGPQAGSTQVLQLKLQIAKQQAVLAQYRAQIIAKTEQLDAVWQSLLRTGNEAGEAEALAIYQRELDKLQRLLAPLIHAAEVTVARLQTELRAKPQLAGSLHQAKVPIVSSQKVR